MTRALLRVHLAPTPGRPLRGDQESRVALDKTPTVSTRYTPECALAWRSTRMDGRSNCRPFHRAFMARSLPFVASADVRKPALTSRSRS